MNGIWPNNEMSAHTCEGKFQYCYLHFLGNDNNHAIKYRQVVT